MAYSKNTWATGDTITAEKLNHMENGIASSLELHTVYDDETMETRYSGEEIQSIATNLPDRLAVVVDFTSDPEYPNYRNDIYRLSAVTEDQNHVPVGCVYSVLDDMNGDGIGAKYLYINCTSEGAVESVATSYATGDSAPYTEFTYDSSTGYWVHSAT